MEIGLIGCIGLRAQLVVGVEQETVEGNVATLRRRIWGRIVLELTKKPIIIATTLSVPMAEVRKE